MRIVTVLGARPQFIKAAMLSRLISDKKNMAEIIVHSGQHYNINLSQVFFDELQLPYPTYNLEVGSGQHGQQTGLMLDRIEQVLHKENPDIVLVYGDTNTTLAGALSASKLNIPVAHIEAGLRSFNRNMPEEINRIVADHVSSVLFAPSATAIKNLKNEGLANKAIFVGDIMYDAILYYLDKIKNKKTILKQNKLEPDNYILSTFHRAENTDNYERLSAIVEALNYINNQIPVIAPLHPRTLKKLKSFKLKLDINVIEPVGYLDMLNLTSNSRLVMTDSGGLQKEAYYCNKYCIILRDETEWVELLEIKAADLAGADYQNVIDCFNKRMHFKHAQLKDAKVYGDGDSSTKIIEKLEQL